MDEVNKGTIHLSTFEEELDYTCRRISQLSTMIDGGEGSEVTASLKKNNDTTATGRKQRITHTQKTEQSEQSLKLEKELELITSACRAMKDKEMKIKDLEEEKKQLQEELSNKEVLIIQLKDKTNRNAFRRQSHQPDIHSRIEAAEENLSAQKKVNADIAKKWEIAEKSLEQKTEEFTKLEAAKKELDSSHENLKQLYQETSKEKQTLEGLKTKLECDISRLNYDVVSLQQREKSLETSYKEQLDSHNIEKRNQEHQIQQLTEENERLLTRLSQITSNGLTQENVNIAGLNDANQSTPLVRIYSDLYDNEWIDALEELMSKGQLSEKRSIEFLLAILLNAFQKGRQITWDRYEAMKSVASTLDITHRLNSSSNKRLEDSRDQATVQLSFSADQEKEITTAWKTMSNAIKPQALELLCSVLITGLEINDKDMPNLARYLNGCVELCWEMGIQENPLHLDIEAEKENGSERVFDADKFRTYTKTGTKVDYIVWPALFVHEGGAMLSKGIAQGY